jgi:hypothetical protein
MSTPYYYKSPAKKKPKEGKDQEGSQPSLTRQDTKGSSKSPVRMTASIKPAVASNSVHFLKLVEELKVVTGQMDETMLEMAHMKLLFENRARLLREEAYREEGELLRGKLGGS